MRKPLIRCENLRKVYVNDRAKTYALRDVDCVINEGEFTAIMGPSGSGKSTLMHILGLLDRPDGGKYFFRGRDVSEFDDATAAELRNRTFGFVFQAFNLLDGLTVAENVGLPLMYDRRHLSRRQRQERVREVLRAVELSDRADFRPNQLSGGQQQRAAIARALVNDPEVIFADEPTGNLDSANGLVVMDILRRLNNEGRTVILVTHETATAAYAERVLRMRDGRIVADEPVENRRSEAIGREPLK